MRGRRTTFASWWPNALTAAALALVGGVSPASAAVVGDPGLIAVNTFTSPRISLYDADGKADGDLDVQVADEVSLGSPRWSPDAQSLAVRNHSATDPSDVYDLGVVPASGG